MSEFWPEGRNEGYAASSDEVKLIRAQGECLGTRSRRRTWLAAISLGESQTDFDPGISEWGNPLEQYSSILP